MKGFLRWGAVIGACCSGCGFDSSGSEAGATLGANETGESVATSGSPTTASGPMTTEGEPGGTDRDDVGTSDSAETSATSADPTIDSKGETDSTSTTGDEQGLGTTDTGFEYYTACPCVDGEESCVEFTNGQTLLANVCYAVPCGNDSDCPLAPNGAATPVCVLAGNGYCGLDCAGGATCPNGMTCHAVENNQFRCAWPVP